jgi:hypothetical protein
VVVLAKDREPTVGVVDGLLVGATASLHAALQAGDPGTGLVVVGVLADVLEALVGAVDLAEHTVDAAELLDDRQFGVGVVQFAGQRESGVVLVTGDLVGVHLPCPVAGPAVPLERLVRLVGRTVVMGDRTGPGGLAVDRDVGVGDPPVYRPCSLARKPVDDRLPDQPAGEPQPLGVRLRLGRVSGGSARVVWRVHRVLKTESLAVEVRIGVGLLFGLATQRAPAVGDGPLPDPGVDEEVDVVTEFGLGHVDGGREHLVRHGLADEGAGLQNTLAPLVKNIETHVDRLLDAVGERHRRRGLRVHVDRGVDGTGFAQPSDGLGDEQRVTAGAIVDGVDEGCRRVVVEQSPHERRRHLPVERGQLDDEPFRCLPRVDLDRGRDVVRVHNGHRRRPGPVVGEVDERVLRREILMPERAHKENWHVTHLACDVIEQFERRLVGGV